MAATFKEDDIRPKDLEEGKLHALQQDLKRLRSYSSQFVEVVCPACENLIGDPAFQKFGFQFVNCNKCDTVYMNPRAPAEVLNDFYANSILYDFWNKYIFPASREARRRKIFRPRVRKVLELLERYNVGKNCLLEVGAGFGIFCEEITKEKVFDNVIALEPSKSLAESCKKLGITTIEKSVENLVSLEVPANFIVSFEVIEHLYSPFDFLRNCHRLMQDDGIIVISCPNIRGFDIMTLGVDSESIDAEHINMFNPKSIGILFERAGFSLLDCETPGVLDAEIVRNRILNGSFDLANQPFLQTVLIDRWEELGKSFQRFLQSNQLSSNMWVVAKKS
jgi:2-polyprenyl-3-methyl-5-hydroxy-6-metoxy-1,4-benzoquinol methylase